MKNKTTSFEVGIDEAGRGALAGPVAVGAVIVPIDFDWGLLEGVGDSKLVTPKNREAIFRRVKILKKAGVLTYAVSLGSARQIDAYGITQVVQKSVGRVLASLAPDPTTSIKLDGLLKAPHIYTNQQTIIRGDALEKSIGLASIIAKVTRDKHMIHLAKKYPHYHFEIHKGYGTEMHRTNIQTYGICIEHRAYFLKNCLSKNGT